MLGAHEPERIRRDPDPEVFQTFDSRSEHEELSYLLETPAFSALLSALVMGLGQLFNGQTRRGLVFLLGQLSLALYAWDHFYGHVVSDALIMWIGEGPYSIFFWALMIGGAGVWLFNVSDAYEVAQFVSFIYDRHSQVFAEDELERGSHLREVTEGRRRGQFKQLGFVAAAVLFYTVAIFMLGARVGGGDDGLEDLMLRVNASQNPELHLNAAQLFFRLERYEDARALYGRAIAHATSAPQREAAELGLTRVEAVLLGGEPGGGTGPDPVPFAVPEVPTTPPQMDTGAPELPDSAGVTGAAGDAGGSPDSLLDEPPPIEPGPERPGLPQTPPGAAVSSFDLEYVRERAQLELSLGNPDGAAEALAQLEGASFEDAGVEWIRGEVARRQGRTDEARVAFERAVEIAPGDSRAFLGLAQLARDRSDASSEEMFLRRAVLAAPANPEAVGEYAEFLSRSGRAEEAHEVVARALTQRPDDAELLFRSYRYSRQAGNSERAHQAALALARAEYRDGEVYEFLARRALERKQLSEAEKYVAVLKGLEPQAERAVVLEADLLQRQRKPREVLRLLKPWIASGNLEMAKILAQSAKDAKEYAVGIQALETALEVHPPEAGAWKLLGILKKRTGDLQGALDSYEEALQLEPRDKEALYLAGYIHYRLGQWEEGLRRYEEVARQHRGYGETDFYLGACYEGAALTRKAIEAYSRVPRQSSNHAKAQESIARLRQARSPEPPPVTRRAESPPITRSAEPRIPPDRTPLPPPNRRVVEPPTREPPVVEEETSFPVPAPPPAADVSVDTYAALLRDAEVSFQEGKMKDALGKYDRILEIKPDHFRSHYQRGLILRELKRPVDAIEALQTARSLDPKHVRNLTELGQLLAEQQRVQPAVIVFEEAIREEPKNLAVRYKLGVLYERRKNYAKAEEQYQAIIWYHPEYKQAHEYLGNVYYKQKKYERAVRAFDALLDAEPKNMVVRFKRALTFLQLGNKDTARRQLKDLLDVLPGEHPLRAQVKSYLETLTG